MENGRAKFNSQTITLKVLSVKTINEHAVQTFAKFDSAKTQLKADAFTALFVSANPIRNDYKLESEDFKRINELKEEANRVVAEMQKLLKNKLESIAS